VSGAIEGWAGGLGLLAAVGAGAWGTFWKVKGRLKQDIRDSTLQNDFEVMHSKYCAAVRNFDEVSDEYNELRRLSLDRLSKHRRLVDSLDTIFSSTMMVAEIILPILEKMPEHDVTLVLMRNTRAKIQAIEAEFLGDRAMSDTPPKPTKGKEPRDASDHTK
jgi:hypothetical protein